MLFLPLPVVCRIIAPMDKDTISKLDRIVDEGLVTGATKIVEVLNDEDAPAKDKIAAFNALSGASSLRLQRQIDMKPQSTTQHGLAALSPQALDALTGAFEGLARLAGAVINGDEMKTAAQKAITAERVQLAETVLPIAPTVSVTVDVPVPTQTVPQSAVPYLQTVTVPRSIQERQNRR